jgi:hypothetical protein
MEKKTKRMKKGGERKNKIKINLANSAMFTYGRKMYFRFDLHNRLEERFSIFIIYSSLKIKINNLL